MADPLPPRRLGRGGLLVALLIGALLLAVLVVYASGFAYLRDEESFAELLVSHNWQDTRIATAFAELFPGKKVRFVSRSGIPIEDMVLSLMVKDRTEREVVRWISGLSDLRIRRSGEAIEVSEPSWLWRAYAALDGRIYVLCGRSLWRIKRPLEGLSAR